MICILSSSPSVSISYLISVRKFLSELKKRNSDDLRKTKFWHESFNEKVFSIQIFVVVVVIVVVVVVVVVIAFVVVVVIVVVVGFCCLDVPPTSILPSSPS